MLPPDLKEYLGQFGSAMEDKILDIPVNPMKGCEAKICFQFPVPINLSLELHNKV